MLHALPRWFRTTEPPRIFVHHSNVLTRGMRALGEGEVVEFDLAEHNSSPVAVGVTAPGGKAVSGTLAHRRVPAERVSRPSQFRHSGAPGRAAVRASGDAGS